MNNRLTSYQLQDFAEEDGNSVFSDPDYAVESPLLLFPDEEESIKVNFLMMLFCLDGNLCLNFDDYASFCKFVKTHIGCSPQNCRNS